MQQREQLHYLEITELKQKLLKKYGKVQRVYQTYYKLGKINFIINTPTRGKEANRDGFKIRRLAVESKVPCFTSLDTANALYDAIEDINTEEVIDVVDITKV